MRLDAALNLSMGEFKISLDRDGSKNCFVSHAHSDHTSALKAKNKNIIASEITLALADYNGDANFNGDGRIKLLNSGHILGSTQLFVEHDGETFVYTGDFKMQDSLTTKKAEVRECDCLVIESTYASPEIVFPEREAVNSQIANWAKKNFESGSIVLLGGYSIGKAQELIKILNEYLDVAPVVESKIEKASRVYEKFGVSLERVPVMTDEAEELMKENFIAVVPPYYATGGFASKLSEIYRRKVACAVATGWALSYRHSSEAFPLSDHADFKQILQYVEQSNPKKIYCCHGEVEKLANELRKRGYDAKPINGLAQTSLNEFSEGD
jgi:Cft2 family RNA processing exonuclease